MRVDIRYGVATISRLLKITGLFCRISPLYRSLLQKRPIILRTLLIEATSYGHIYIYMDHVNTYIHTCIHDIYMKCHFSILKTNNALRLVDNGSRHDTDTNIHTTVCTHLHTHVYMPHI